jgi:hypothetical protein
VQRAAIFAGIEFGISRGRLFESAVFGERDDKVQRWVVALEAREVQLGEIERCRLVLTKQLAQLTDGGEGEFLFLRCRDVSDRRSGAENDGLRGRGLRCGRAGGNGIEDGRWCNAVGEMQFADAERGVTLADQPVEHHLLLLGREFQCGDDRRCVDHLGRDRGPASQIGLCGRLGIAGSRGEGDQGAGQQRAAETGGGGNGEEAAARGSERFRLREGGLRANGHAELLHRREGRAKFGGDGLWCDESKSWVRGGSRIRCERRGERPR